MRVLIAEDDEGIRALIEIALLDHDLISVPDGAGALEALESQSFDVAVLDVMMPEVDGLAVTRAIRKDERRGDIPIVLLTALVREDDHIKGFEAGADVYVTKPFHPQRFTELLEELVDTPVRARQQQRVEALEKARLLRQLENRF